MRPQGGVIHISATYPQKRGENVDNLTQPRMIHTSLMMDFISTAPKLRESELLGRLSPMMKYWLMPSLVGAMVWPCGFSGWPAEAAWMYFSCSVWPLRITASEVTSMVSPGMAITRPTSVLLVSLGGW